MRSKKPSISEHLASLSVQYDVYPAELFQALVGARKSGKAKASCQQLSVEYRGSVDDEAIFLIKQNESALVQFRVGEDTLLREDFAFDDWMDNSKIRKQIAKLNPQGPVSAFICDLRHGMKKVNLEGKVLKIDEPRMVYTQFGNSALLANATIEDETGKIKLCLWDKQVNSIAVGDKVQVANATVATFKGEKQLRLGKTGTVTVAGKEGIAAKAKDAIVAA